MNEHEGRGEEGPEIHVFHDVAAINAAFAGYCFVKTSWRSLVVLAAGLVRIFFSSSATT
jgi:hypothetical protein